MVLVCQVISQDHVTKGGGVTWVEAAPGKSSGYHVRWP